MEQEFKNGGNVKVLLLVEACFLAVQTYGSSSLISCWTTDFLLSNDMNNDLNTLLTYHRITQERRDHRSL